MLASSPARPRHATPPYAPFRHAGGMSGFWVRQVFFQKHEQSNSYLKLLESKKQKPVESETRTYHGRVGSGRPAERPGGVGQDCVPTELFAQKKKVYCTLQTHQEMSLQRVSRSTNKRNSMLTDGETKSPVDLRYITGLSAGREALFVSGRRPVERSLLVSGNPFHARYVREYQMRVRRGGGAESGRNGCQQDCLSRKQVSTHPLRYISSLTCILHWS